MTRWACGQAIGVAAALCCGAAACSTDIAPLPAAAEVEWLAMVGDEPVTKREVAGELAKVKHEYRHVPAHEVPNWATVKEALLENAIERRLLLQEARRRGIRVPAADIEKAVRLSSAGYERDRFEENLLATGQTLTEFRAGVEERLSMEALFREAVFKPIRVEDSEARAHYQANPERFAVPEAVHVLHIAVRMEPEARRLWERIHNGASFEELARRYSVSPDGAKSGDVGFITRGQKPRFFEDACFRLKPGQLSPVTPSEYGYHLFKVLEKRAMRSRTFEEARSEVVAELRREKERAAEITFRREVRARTPVQIDTRALQRVK
jgi:peptidyl-prolyl cis-trans isomerase C/foldase protein PrsA